MANFDIGALKEYFSTDEAKIAMGVWAGGFVTDIVAKTVFNAIFKDKNQENNKLKLLAIEILVKGLTGSVFYMMGEDNVFLRYMAIGSLVSVFNSIANYFMPAPSAIAQKASNYVANLRPGVVVQTV